MPSEALQAHVQTVFSEHIARVECPSSWEAAAIAGALSIEVRKATSALTFEHYPLLTDGRTAGQAFTARLSEFCRRTTMSVGRASPGVGLLGPAAELAKLQKWAASTNRKLLMVVGGTDLFGLEEDEILDAVRPSANVDVILTRTDTTAPKPGFRLPQWSGLDMSAFVETYLSRHRKALDADDASALLAHPLAYKLSYLRFVCDWLVSFARFETLPNALQQCLRVDTFAGLADCLMEKGREEMTEPVWSAIASAALGNTRGCTEAELISGTGLLAKDVYVGLSILSPMLEMWSGRIWRHRGQDWDALGNAILDQCAPWRSTAHS
jgi:hypothetical protein